MRLDDLRPSSNVSDRRGMGGGTLIAGGGIGTLILALVYMFLGGDPSAVINNAPAAQQPQSTSTAGGPPDRDKEWITKILGSTEDTWKEQLPAQANVQYRDPQLVLFSNYTQSACGVGQSAMGPFYCPLDESVYIDLSFYRELRERFQAPGDFAQAYVIGHEVGHHVQKLLGTSDQVHQAQERAGKREANALSVALELQADCYAGVWAFHANQKFKMLEAGDVEEALTAASAIGDDNIQRQTQGRVVPESFTHGSAEQRMHWFQTGMQSGDMRRCDTFQGY